MYLEKLRLDGQLAFITGGGRGIGLATAQAFLEAGAEVVLADLDPAVLAQGMAELRNSGHHPAGIEVDVTDPAALNAAAEKVEKEIGKVSIVVANAGLAHPDTGAEDVSDELWLKLLDVNLNGSFWTCRAFSKPMLSRGRGSIVTVGSMSGLISNKPQRQVHYNAAKAGVHHMTRSLAGEWAQRGIRVNSVAPTYVDTAMSRGAFTDPVMFPVWMDSTPMRRVATAEEVASAIHFLASDASSAITGSILTVDCGYTIW
jgi:NAD(P)-dependent dehydrogenase (short-subunit alcohol dehydrogenase family)